MKRRLLAAFLAVGMVVTLLPGCTSQKEDKKVSGNSVSESQEENSKKEMTDITLNEVAHSIFYAPMYVAIEKGYFEEEGINLDLVCGLGADNLVQNRSKFILN
ncbi:MAG: ABC transporter substrate-binding protein [Muricomes sp.]